MKRYYYDYRSAKIFLDDGLGGLTNQDMEAQEFMEHNCGFRDGNRWFRYRAAAIIVEDGYVLFAGNENEDYFYSVGGAVHMGETAEEAV